MSAVSAKPAKPKHHIGPYARPATLTHIDGRSKEARFKKTMRASLAAHVGNKPSAVQSALIELAIDTAFQIELMKRHRDASGALTAHDHRQFLAWANTLSRTLRQLGMEGAAESGPDLAEYLAEKAGA